MKTNFYLDTTLGELMPPARRHHSQKVSHVDLTGLLWLYKKCVNGFTIELYKKYNVNISTYNFYLLVSSQNEKNDKVKGHLQFCGLLLKH